MRCATVTVDSVSSNVDLYAPDAQNYAVPAFTRAFSTTGSHTVTVKPSGSKNAKSSSTTVTFDATTIASSAIVRADRARWNVRLRDRLGGPVIVGRVPTRLIVVLVLAALLATLVIIVAGQHPGPIPLIPAERGVFTPTGSMTFGRENPAAVLLAENGSYRVATGELTGQIQSLENVINDLGTRSMVDPAQARAMQKLPAVVRSRAAGGTNANTGAANSAISDIAKAAFTTRRKRSSLRTSARGRGRRRRRTTAESTLGGGWKRRAGTRNSFSTSK